MQSEAGGLTHPGGFGDLTEALVSTDVSVLVQADLYDAARQIADMRGETVEDVAVQVLRKYARGRTRPRD
jgi:hypothetical protein